MMRPVGIGRRRLLGGAVAAGLLAAGVPGVARAQGDEDNQRFRGYSPADRAQPYARFMADRTAAPQQVVADAYAGPPTPAESIPEFAGLTTDLGPTGYSPVETGYGRTAGGAIWVGVRTEMPRVSAAMWDWWFGWHLVESARYKLWHPDAHMYAEVAADRVGQAGPDRDKYVGNISYVDEYIGDRLQQLAIAFHDPVAYGFAVPADQTIVFGRVGSSIAPVDLGWLAHQVRPTAAGCEMRSRFYLRVFGTHAPDAFHTVRAIERGPSANPGDLLPGLDMARDLMLHCGQEMNHLARFLPELYTEFGPES